MGDGDRGETRAQGQARWPRRGASMAALAVLAGLTLLLAARPIFAVDLFWLLALGRQIDLTGAIPSTDLFSAVHPDRAWVQFQWLWEWGAYRIVAASGLGGLRLVNGSLITLGLLGFYVVSRRSGASRGASLLLVSLGLALTIDRFRLRPDALNFALMVGALPLLSGGYRRLSVPGLFACAGFGFLWASLHGGGVLYLIGSVCLVCLGDAVQLRIASRSVAAMGRGVSATDVRRAFALLIAVTLGAAAAPTTLPGLWHFFSIYREMAGDGGEWAGTWSMLAERRHPLNVIIVASPWLGALGYAVWAKGQRAGGALRLGQVLWVFASLVMSVLSLRFVFLSVVAFWSVATATRASAPAEAHTVGQAGGPTGPTWRRHSRTGALWLGSLVLTGLIAHYGLIGPRGSLKRAARFALRYDLEPTAFPEAALSFVAATGLQGGAICSRKHGGALIYYGYPRLRVLADSRHNFTPQVWDLVRRIERPMNQIDALDSGFARYGLELAVLERPLVRYRRPSAAWQLLFESRATEVWQHREGPHAQDNLRAQRRLARQHGLLDAQTAAQPVLDAQVTERAAHALGRALDRRHPYHQDLLRRIDLRLAEVGPRRHGALRALARVSIEGRDFGPARAALAQLPPGADTPRSQLYRAVVAHHDGHARKAAQALKSALGAAGALPPREAAAAIELARLQAR